MNIAINRIIATSALLLASSCIASAQHVDHYTPATILERAAPLQQKAATAGAAAATLEEYGVDHTMISVRTRDGLAEQHEKFADIFVIVEGKATLRSGGEMVDSKLINPGESTGSSLVHFTETALAKGDVVHIPANLPHQLMVPSGTTLTYFVIKIKEKE